VQLAILRRYLKNKDEARALVRELFVSSADIESDNLAGTISIHIHRMASQVNDKAIAALLGELTEQEFCHPETGVKMVFALV
jgi:hypothetical protein